MTAPRKLLPGTTYLVTRRCTQNEWLLRGDSETNRIFLYWLTIAVMRTGVDVHGYVLMANHWHAVVTDVLGNLPEFLHCLNRNVAVDMNIKLERSENFWSSRRTDIVPLHTAELVLQKLAEIATHPIAASLVKSPGDWPGLVTTRLCEKHVAHRPKGHEGGYDEWIPESADLECTMPPALQTLAPEDAARLLKARIAELTAQARERVRGHGGGFLGADRVRTAPRSGPPTSHASASRAPWVRRFAASFWKALDEQMDVFHAAYRAALQLWRQRERSAEFPDGTYLMRVFHRADCFESAES